MKLITILLLISFNISAQVGKFDKKHIVICADMQKKHGLPISVLLTISYFESNGGKSENAIRLNNYFNLCAYQRNSKFYLPIVYQFEDKSFEDFCILVKYLCKEADNYSFTDYKLWIKTICKKQITRFKEEELIKHIEENKIYLFDKL